MKKRLMALALACIMILGIVPVSAVSAVGGEATASSAVKASEATEYVPLTQDVVFVSENGTGTKDGKSAENSATLQDALGLTKKNGGTIVVCAPISLDECIDGKYYFPSHDGNITITSVYNGVDYRETANASITLSKIAFFYGDYVFESVKFISAGDDARFYLLWNNITFGDDIVCERASGATNDIAIICGSYVPSSYIASTYEVSCHEDAEIIIKSGTWSYINGGNRRNNSTSCFGTIDAGVSVIIRIMGGNFTYTGTDRSNSVVGMNSVDGEIYMEISGGEFASSVYLSGRVGSKREEYDPAIKGKVTLNITGGTFKKNAIGGFADSSQTHSVYSGAEVILAITGGTFPNNRANASGISYSYCRLYVSESISTTVSNMSGFAGTAKAADVKEPTLLYNKTVYTAPPVYDKEIEIGPDIFELTEEDEAKLTTEAKEKLELVRKLAQLDGTKDAQIKLRTLTDTNNDYNFNRVVSARLVTLLTGEYSINKSITNYGMGGSGGGYMIDCEDFVLFIFGDIEDEGELGGPWRANALAFSDDMDYTDGIEFDGFYLNDSGEHDGIASEILHSEHTPGVEYSKIPTGGFKIGDTLYIGYMSVRTWDDEGVYDGPGSTWRCNYGAFAKSTDMGRSWETPSDLRWPEESGRIQPFPVVDGDMVYVFTVKEGRNGTVKLMRVHKDDFENIAAYEYMVGRDANGNAIYERGYDAMMSDYYIVDKYCGGVEVMWNDYLQEWIMVYASSQTGSITRGSVVMRVAKTLDGEWSDPVVIMSQSTYGAVYEPRILERYNSEGGKKIMIICSRWDVYNSLIFEVELEKKETDPEGSFGTALTWKLNSDGLLEINGEGAMPEFESASERPWHAYINSITAVKIGGGVSFIDDKSFYQCSNLKKIEVDADNEYYYAENGVLFSKDKTLLHTYPIAKTGTSYTVPEGVTTIGYCAFYGSTYLTAVKLPSTLVTISEKAFANCKKITNIDLSEGLQIIDGYAFYSCTGLLSVEIPESVTSIGTQAFRYCSALTKAVVNNSGTTFAGDYIFGGVSSSFELHGLSGSTAEDYASKYGHTFVVIDPTAGSVVLPEGAIAYFNPNAITEDISGIIGNEVAVVISGSAGITSIAAHANKNVSQVNVSLNEEGDCKFVRFTNEGQYTYSQFYINLDSSVFTESGIYYFSLNFRLSKDYTCTDSSGRAVLARIVSGGKQCNNVVVTANALATNGYTEWTTLNFAIDAAYGAPTVLRLIIFANPGDYIDVKSVAIYDEDPASDDPSTDPDSEFIGTGTLGEGLTWKLYNTGLLEIDGEGVMPELDSASERPWQSYTSSITAVKIGAGVQFVDDKSFYQCYKLASIEVDPENEYYCAENGVLFSKDKTLLHTYPIAKTETSYTVPEGVTTIGYCAFYGSTHLTEVKLPSTLLLLCEKSFANCTKITNITLPAGLKTIEGYVFYGCTGLISIELPASVTIIGTQAFCGCSALTKAVVNNPFAEIVGGQVFRNVSADFELHGYTGSTAETHASSYGYTFVSLGEIPKTLVASGDCGENLTWDLYTNGELVISGSGAMYNWTSYSNVPWYTSDVPWYNYLSSIKTVTIESGVTSIGNNAFSNCTKLTSTDLPASVTSIGSSAFEDCTSLTSIDLPAGVTSIGDFAFYACDSLTSIDIPDSVTSIGNYAFWGCDSLTKAVVNSPFAKFQNDVFYNVSADFELHGYTGSTAEAYANANGHTFVSLGEIPVAKYTVTFKDYDGRVISSAEYEEGSTVVAPEAPVREADDTYTYTFTGWDKEVTTVSGNAEYVAQYEAQYIDYTVVFKNHNGDAISTATYHYGDTVAVPATPTRAADKTYTYTFIGWDKEVTTVSGNAEYVAQYEAQYIEYTVVFKNYNGDVISTATYHYGDTVAVPATPTRAADKTYTYTFTGWDMEVTIVDGNAEYVAQYEAQYIEYTVVFKNYNGDVISTATHHYGDTVAVPEAPVREADDTYTYTFIGWDKEVTIVDGNAEYVAQYKAVRKAVATVANAKGKPGETVTLDITLENSENVGSLAISEITYNSEALELVSFEWKLNDPILSYFDAEQGMGAAAFEGAKDANGVIGTFTFKIKDGAGDGDYAVSCNIEAKIGKDAYEVSDVAGTVTVCSVVRGDADGDEYITKNDAIFVLMYTFFPELYPANQDLDFNGDGYVTKDDAIYVLMYTFFPDLYPIE